MTKPSSSLYRFIRWSIGILLCGVVMTLSAQQPYPRYPGYQAPYGYGQPGRPQPYGQPGQQSFPYAPPSTQQQPYSQPGRQQPYSQPGRQQPYSQPRQQPYPYGQPGQQQPYGRPGQPYPYNQPRQQQPPHTQPRQRQPFSQPGQQPPGRPASQPRGSQQPWSQPPPGYGASPGQGVSEAPRLEVSVSDLRPYVQQTVVLSLRIISSNNLETVQPEIPGSGGLVISKLDGPIARARTSGGKQEIVNEYRYAVTPLSSGAISIPALRVKGTLSGGRGSEFDVVAPASKLLEVQPVDASVQPWLPLHGLLIQSYMQGAESPEAGKPLSLVIDISAVGATGGQLPTFEKHLRSSDFNVYREKSEIQGNVSSDGQFLLGNRNETFTLVPKFGGKIQIPELTINWWNVDTGRPEKAIVPIRQLIAKGTPSSGDEKIGDLFPGASSVLLWLPLIGLFGLTIGIWILAWLRQKRFGQVVEEEITVVARFSVKQIRVFFAWLAPIRRLQKVRQLFVRSLPKSYRLWFCVRVVESETDPEVWSYMLKFLVNKHLGIPPQIPLRQLADTLTDIHPHADRSIMRKLMGELDGCLYGENTVEFSTWKKRFREQLKPSLIPVPGRGRSRRGGRPRLPSLNPGT